MSNQLTFADLMAKAEMLYSAASFCLTMATLVVQPDVLATPCIMLRVQP